jgi:phosphate transport system substrate-binding protein
MANFFHRKYQIISMLFTNKALILYCPIFYLLFHYNCSIANANENNSTNLTNFFSARPRNHISIVGSSTVYPFMAIIAENFGRETDFRTPIIESTGTGGGFKFFCSGIGFEFPDFVNASRPIKKSELEKCQSNKITPREIKIGYDAIVLASSTEGTKFNLTSEQIFLAIAENVPDKFGKMVKNFYQNWNEIDTKLPAIPIAIYGPPSTSGTRDAFVELIMLKSCDKIHDIVKNYPDPQTRHKKCQIIRSDGIFMEAGENDNLIVQKLKNNHQALGIFGYSFLQENKKHIQPANIDNSEPTFKNILSNNYKISRPLFIYYKPQHLNLIKGVKEFIQEIVNRKTIGKNGYLLQTGLLPLSDQEIAMMEEELLKDL